MTTTRTDTPSALGVEVALWRAVAVYRVGALIYATIVIMRNSGGYEHTIAGWAVLGGMALWTAYAVYAYSDPVRRGWPLLVTDLAVASAAVLATAFVETAEHIDAGHPTLPVSWVAAAVLAWAVTAGKRGGLVSAAVIGVADVLVLVIAGGGPSFEPTQSTFNGIVLLFLTGLVGGHVVTLALESEERLERAVRLEAATRERERLARDIHDSVLQVLALVSRRGNELGGEAAELGRLAGDQEAALRHLIGAQENTGSGSATDLRTLLGAHSSITVTVSTPATPVPLPARTAHEIEAAVKAALDNVRRHCGEDVRAWVLLEDGDGTVTVSVRDEGPGMPAGRLVQAEAAGRLGVAQSIRGRIRDLGGTVAIISAPGDGTEIEMSVPVP